MDDKTLFYIVGGTLAVLAVLISFVGIRDKGFPPEGAVSRAVLGFFAVLVAAAAATAILGAREEQAERREHLAAEGIHNEEGDEEGQIEPGQQEEAGEGAVSAGSEDVDGAQLFDENGCGGCHALTAAGATGALGPDLDVTLEGQDVAYIEEAIVDPNAEIVDGFEEGIMPTNFGDQLSSQELKALATYIEESVAEAQSG